AYAAALQAAGCFSVVAEAVPAAVAAEMAKLLDAPVIGIGAGPDVDGQVLVLHDLAGLTPDPAPRFVRRYASLRETLTAAVRAYADDVRTRAFPTVEHTYPMSDDELRSFRDRPSTR